MGCERRGQSQGPSWVQSIRQSQGGARGSAPGSIGAAAPSLARSPHPKTRTHSPDTYTPWPQTQPGQGVKAVPWPPSPLGWGPQPHPHGSALPGLIALLSSSLLSLLPVWELGTAPTGQRTRCWGTCCPAPSSRLRLGASAMPRASLGARHPSGCVSRGRGGLTALLPLPKRLRESRLPPVVPCSRPGRIQPAPRVSQPCRLHPGRQSPTRQSRSPGPWAASPPARPGDDKSCSHPPAPGAPRLPP